MAKSGRRAGKKWHVFDSRARGPQTPDQIGAGCSLRLAGLKLRYARASNSSKRSLPDDVTMPGCVAVCPIGPIADGGSLRHGHMIPHACRQGRTLSLLRQCGGFLLDDLVLASLEGRGRFVLLLAQRLRILLRRLDVPLRPRTSPRKVDTKRLLMGSYSSILWWNEGGKFDSYLALPHGVDARQEKQVRL